MSRYVTRKPHAWFDYGEDFDARSVQPLGQPTVYDAGSVDTGIIDKHGNPVFRSHDEVGFYPKDRKS